MNGYQVGFGGTRKTVKEAVDYWRACQGFEDWGFWQKCGRDGEKRLFVAEVKNFGVLEIPLFF